MLRNRRLRRLFDRWLRAELSGRDARADSALRRFFSRLESPSPSPGFAAQVLARCGLRVAPRSTDLTGFRARAAVAVACLGTALAFVYLPSLVAAIWVGVKAGRPVELAGALLVGLSQRLIEGVSTWRALVDVAELVTAAFSAPQVLAVLAGACLLSAGAFRLLQGLLVPARSTNYANLG